MIRPSENDAQNSKAAVTLLKLPTEGAEAKLTVRIVPDSEEDETAGDAEELHEKIPTGVAG